MTIEELSQVVYTRFVFPGKFQSPDTVLSSWASLRVIVPALGKALVMVVTEPLGEVMVTDRDIRLRRGTFRARSGTSRVGNNCRKCFIRVNNLFGGSRAKVSGTLDG